jgi:RNA polymerase sigma-70 factor (ECF subfamily)
MPAATLKNSAPEVQEMQPCKNEVFNNLYNHYAPALLGYIHNIVCDQNESEKILQTTFLGIWQTLDEYSPGNGPVFTLLLQQVKNTIVHYRLSQEKTKTRENQNALSHVNIYNNLDKNCQDAHKTVINLLYYDNYSLKDASLLLNINEDQVKRLLRHAIKNLKNIT